MLRGWGMKRKVMYTEEYLIVPAIFKDIVVNDDFEEATIQAILKAGSTGEVGDGKIFVSQVDEVYRIRTAEKGGQTLK